MKTIKTVFKKIAEDKTELSSERIELSLADDMKQATEKMKKDVAFLNKRIGELSSYITEFKKYKRFVFEDGVRLEKLVPARITSVPKLIKEVEKMAKELGFNANSSPDYQKLIKEFSNLEEANDAREKAIEAAKKIGK